MKLLTKDCILESHNGILTGLREKICMLEIIFQVHDMKGVSHPSSPPQWEHTQILCVFVFITWNGSFCWAKDSHLAADCFCLFNTAIKNGHSSYEDWAIKHSKPSGGVFLFILHRWQFGTCKDIKSFKDLANISRFCQAFFSRPGNLLASSFLAV